MSVLSNESFYWANDETIFPARYTVDSEGNAICTHTFSLKHVFDECTSIDDYGLYYAFYGCTGITRSVSFPELTSIGSYGLNYAFSRCTGITGNISFPKLINIGERGLYYAFSGCKGITGNISFPKLINIGERGLSYAFYGCTGINEIHFRSDAQSIVEANESYSSNFGAMYATIFFDL